MRQAQKLRERQDAARRVQAERERKEAERQAQAEQERKEAAKRAQEEQERKEAARREQEERERKEAVRQERRAQRERERQEAKRQTQEKRETFNRNIQIIMMDLNKFSSGDWEKIKTLYAEIIIEESELATDTVKDEVSRLYQEAKVNKEERDQQEHYENMSAKKRSAFNKELSATSGMDDFERLVKEIENS